MEGITNSQYQKELFIRLRKSINLKREEQCFGSCLKTAAWWIIEKPHPKPSDLKKLIYTTCPYVKKVKGPGCVKSILKVIKNASKARALVKFNCLHGLRGFVYPLALGGKLYGYIGACYSNKDVPVEVLDIFAAFTDTIVKETQKELELSKLYETIRPRAIALSTVHTVHRLISSTLDLNELLPRIARLSLQIVRANRCSIKLIDSKKKILLPKATIDLREKKTMLKKVKVGKWAPGKAVKFGKPIRARDYMAMPLIDEDVVGVITLYDKIDRKPFTQFDQEIMATLAEQAVIAIKNAQLYKEQERITMGSIKSLAAILDTRAPGTYVPKASFRKITMAIGQGLRMNSQELKSLEYAALLHDAGQVVVPDDVLAKPAKLTGKEYDIVKEHPLKGAEIVKHMKALKTVVPVILHHHEKYDGSGYPKGLKGAQIPTGSRIMAVVGAFEAMITKKPYRETKTINEAAEEIRINSGTQFDPKVVEIFLRVIKRKDIRAMLEKEIYGSK